MIPVLHVVTDDDVLSRPDVAEVSVRILETFDDDVAVHVRGPRTSGRRLWDVASTVHSAMGGGALFVNDRVDVAMGLDGCGVQLPARSLPVGVARRLLGPDRRIGLSVRASGGAPVPVSEVGKTGQVERVGPGGGESAGDPAAGHLFVGTTFPTPSHPDGPVAGVEAVGRVASMTPIPVIAIGGISVQRIGVLVPVGVHGIAVIRAVWDAADPVEAVDTLLSTWRRAVQESSREGA